MGRADYRNRGKFGIGIAMAFAVLVVSAVAGTVPLLLGSAVYGMPMFWSYFTSPLLLALNLLPPVLLALFLYYLFGRAWVAVGVTSLVTTVLSVMNYCWIIVRGAPLLASDLMRPGKVWLAVSGVFGTGGWRLDWQIYAAIGVFLALVLASLLFLSGDLPYWWVRLTGAVLIAGIACVLCMYVYTSEDVYNRAECAATVSIDPELDESVSHGALYSFIYDIQNSQVASPPSEGEVPDVTPLRGEN